MNTHTLLRAILSPLKLAQHFFGRLENGKPYRVPPLEKRKFTFLGSFAQEMRVYVIRLDTPQRARG